MRQLSSKLVDLCGESFEFDVSGLKTEIGDFEAALERKLLQMMK